MANNKKKRPGVIDLETGKPLDEVEEVAEEMPTLNQIDAVSEKPAETVAEPVQASAEPVGEVAREPAKEAAAPIGDRLKAVVAKSVAGTPTLLQFDKRDGKPCSVLVELDISSVKEAWRLWCAENGASNREAFVVALHDAMDAYPVRIMRPCAFYDMR